MDWLYNHGFLSWDAALAVAIIGYLCWPKSKRAKEAEEKEHAEWMKRFNERNLTDDEKNK